MTEINRRYFDSLLEARNLSLRGLAKRMGMSHSQLSLVLSGARRLQLDEAAQLSSIFGEPIARIVEAAGVSVRSFSPSRVSVIGSMGSDGTVSLNPEGVIERTHAPDGLPEDTIAIQARTAGTPLDWIDGWVMFASAPSGVDSAILGRFAYCKVKNGPACIASVRRGYTERTYNLRGPYSADSVSLEFATPILITRH